MYLHLPAAWKGQFLPDPLSDGCKPQSMSSGIALIIVSTHPKVVTSEEKLLDWESTKSMQMPRVQKSVCETPDQG